MLKYFQIDKYMPLLSSGEMVGAIAMTEPDAGSDLQGIRTKAKREGENGDFILNGSKVSDSYMFTELKELKLQIKIPRLTLNL